MSHSWFSVRETKLTNTEAAAKCADERPHPLTPL